MLPPAATARRASLERTDLFRYPNKMKINPDAAGLDAKRLERITDHINNAYIAPQKLAGCQVAVTRHGQVGYMKSFGSMDLERGKPVRDDTIWRIYSMSKPITGVALMTLYEQGHFQLGDPVSRFIPEWRDLKVEERDADGKTRVVDARQPMTVKHLMMHMSGLGYGRRAAAGAGAGAATRAATEAPSGAQPSPEAAVTGGLDLRGGGQTLETMVQRLADQPLAFHPGEKWLYGVSTDVCGRLVEIMSGQQFDEYLKENIFDPLGMVDTGFVVPDENIDRFAANYGRTQKKTLRLVDDPEKSSYRRQPSFLSGGGGLVSTMGDYIRFCQMLVNGGELDGNRVLGRKTIDLMRANHLPNGGTLSDYAIGPMSETRFEGVGFGLTMAVSLDPVEVQTIGSPGDYYWGGAASTIFWIDPAEDLAVVLMTQLMPSNTFNFRGQLKTLVYPAIID